MHTEANVITDTRTNTRATRAAENDHALTTATGSHCQRWYDGYEVVNDGTATSFYFVDDPHPAPRWITSPGRGPQGLIFDPWTVAARETEPYVSPVDRVVLVSAERAWLRGLRGR
jgi:hypothetical protein